MKKSTVYMEDASRMSALMDSSIDLIVTSPPYFNIKDYSFDGVQKQKHSNVEKKDIGRSKTFKQYLLSLDPVWKECFRVLKPNGKLCLNVPLLPILKKEFATHYNRHIFDLQSELQHQILSTTKFFLMDIYIWNRTNSTKKLMFGSYPNPGNFYAQNTAEFIAIYVKDGKSPNKRSLKSKKSSELSLNDWLTYTRQIWDLPIPNKSDSAFGKHSALMPEEIAKRLIRLFSFEGDVVLDPFAGSGTTLKVANQLKRNAVGYEIYKHYANVIREKVKGVEIINE